MEAKIQEILKRLDPQASAYFKEIIPEYQKGYVDYIYQSDICSVQKRRLKYMSKLFQVWQKKPWYYIMPLTQHSAEIIAKDWQYPAPYDFYDLAADPEDYAEIMDPELRQNSYFQVIRNGILFGFASFEKQGSELEIGLGMAPKWTGQSHGAAFLKAIEEYAQANYQAQTLVLNVATFNSRAIKCYENLGYQAETTFKQATNGSVYDFVRMTKAVEQDPSSKN
ncbi:GNAT family acetyltransferase [Streptococcus penaeicida]|uniref:GNAT family acetyltransferase n=1 Tax=Streptococcus penaeicida TaxID=1765960 RepID=A0A2N8LCF9_9STRE|nr:GNAT family protein [Streptococcus penaeicida]PND47851.1 GNAT family acetyltransferase [Streptococcus penaeicida]